MKAEQPLWGRGIMISPQHFQQQVAYRLYGAVCKPGTHDVVARFLLAREWEEREQLNQIWSYLCMYMQHDNALPEPRESAPPDFWRPRKADKWPEEMERESTTAPEQQPAS